MTAPDRVEVADAIGYLAAIHPSETGQAIIDLLRDGCLEAFRRPDGTIAFRSTGKPLPEDEP